MTSLCLLPFLILVHRRPVGHLGKPRMTRRKEGAAGGDPQRARDHNVSTVSHPPPRFDGSVIFALSSLRSASERLGVGVGEAASAESTCACWRGGHPVRRRQPSRGARRTSYQRCRGTGRGRPAPSPKSACCKVCSSSFGRPSSIISSTRVLVSNRPLGHTLSPRPSGTSRRHVRPVLQLGHGEHGSALAHAHSGSPAPRFLARDDTPRRER